MSLIERPVKPPEVSIIVCTRDRLLPLEATLRSLSTTGVPPNVSVELVLVDNGSGGVARSVAEAAGPFRFDLVVVEEPRPGLSRARNTGVRMARGKVLLFTDDDVRFPEGWIDRMSAPIRVGKADAVAGGVRIAPHLLRPWMTRTIRAALASTDSLDSDKPHRLVGANMGISADVFASIPGFDEEMGAGALGFGEESLLAFQLLASGGRVAAALDVAVEHHFDERRLAHSSLTAVAEAMGRSEAYISYHWKHRTVSPFLLHPAATALSLQQKWYRRNRAGAGSDPEGITQEEFQRIRKWARARQHLVERRRDRLYDHQGLVKRPQATPA